MLGSHLVAVSHEDAPVVEGLVVDAVDAHSAVGLDVDDVLLPFPLSYSKN